MDAGLPSQFPSLSVPGTPLYVGIDVAKETLDVAFKDDPDAQVFTISNDSPTLLQLVQRLEALKPQIIVIESTGGLERPLLEALLDAQLPVALVHPGRVRYFARGLGILAKTDRIDARVLVRFARLAEPRLAERRSKSHDELRDLLTCRRQLIFTRTQQTNRRGATFSKSAIKSIDAVIKTLDKQIESLDKQIRDLIDSDDDFNYLNKLLQSVPGVGPGVSATLAADLHELGQTDRQCVAALAGVAPFPDDSGKTQGKRSIRGGRNDVRSALYMATLSAVRYNPVIKIFAQRLKAAGKVNKVMITACMRKLLALLNAMVREGLSWDELNVVKKLAASH